MDYLLYGLFFGFMTFLVWGRRKTASPLLYIGISLFWSCFLIQIAGITYLYYYPTRYSWEKELLVGTIGGMLTSALMMAHAVIKGKEKDER